MLLQDNRKLTMFTLNCKGRLLIINEPIVMGIINTTPDSFYSNSRKSSVDEALRTTEQMLKDGAVIVDIGGQSTRPGSEQINSDEELTRILPTIEAVHQHFPEAFISVDTYHSNIAKHAVECGADIVNDISGGWMDDQMLNTVASLHVPFICMHIKGDVSTMHDKTVYENVTREVLDFFIERTAQCKLAGIHDVIIDPGFGFSKTIDNNYHLLKELQAFSILQKPLLLGISRKSMIWKRLHITPDEALNGTTVLHTIGLLNGATILRAHDVKEAVECINLFQSYRK